MQGYAWPYLIVNSIDCIIYAYNYICEFSLFADGCYIPLCNPYPCHEYMTLLGMGMGRLSDTQGYTHAFHYVVYMF